MNWSTIEREAYAVLSALKKFDCWIFGSQIQVVSDYNPLTFLTKGLPHGTKLARWALALQRYDLRIIYRLDVMCVCVTNLSGSTWSLKMTHVLPLVGHARFARKFKILYRWRSHREERDLELNEDSKEKKGEEVTNMAKR
ncbi:hypothetical protein TNCV_3279351 [Trichonephila clavipes]|nr:hypothetical protein TNCV_3279351 [Trichonephila clavipes]